MKSIFKNKLNLFLFFLLLINLVYIKNISYFKLDILKNSFNKNWIPIYSIYRDEIIESKFFIQSFSKSACLSRKFPLIGVKAFTGIP